ncbi:hypothetical protein BsWGS_07137 [Bradybaena similaris]
MPGRVKVRILSARDLPVMDRASELTDAFVEVKFGVEIFKTEVCKKSLNPQWNSEWFKFEVDDEVLQDEPLDLRVLDYDTYSAHDTIGKVYIDLNPLLTHETPNIISGWFPIYDTMQGLRGELNIQVRVELFSDFNKFRQSSCGIQFFCTSAVPSGWCVQSMLGFIEELVVNDDPEYHWIEKIRTPRASNEARQRLFSKLSGTLQRKLGVKVLEMGGNAVLGYFQNFDLEGESGIVVRAIGTAVALTRVQFGQMSPSVGSPSSASPVKDMRRHTVSLLHHHSHSSHRQDKPLPSHPALKKNLSSPDPTPSASTSAVSIKTCLFTQRRSDINLYHNQPPSAPPIVERAADSSDPSLFTFPCSVPIPDDSTQTPSTSPVLHLQQQQQGKHSPELTTTAVSAAGTKSTSASSSFQQLHQRHSVSPVRVIPATDASRRLSDSEIGSPPKTHYVHPASAGGLSVTMAPRLTHSKTSVLQQNIELLEYPFFTMRSFPAGFIQNLGGVVSARSVKLLDKIHNPEEPETRDAWWREVRIEIKSHAAKLGCHAVLGYMEQTTINDDVIVLSAVGTAAKINLNFDPSKAMTLTSSSQVPACPSFGTDTPEKVAGGGSVKKERDKEKHLFVDIGLANQAQLKSLTSSDGFDESQTRCSLCHIPYSLSNMPFQIQLSKCATCRKKNVPEVLFTTVDPPPDMPVWSRGCLIQARICRVKSKVKSSEQSARDISDSLPFLEYEVHNQLINKLKIRGLNCLFGLRIQICIGENMLVAVATATGAFLGPLPAPPLPEISTEVATENESQDLINLQERLTKVAQTHRERLDKEIKDHHPEEGIHNVHADEETADDEEDGNLLLLELAKDKNTFVLVVDDLKDDTVSIMLHDNNPPEGFEICNTQIPPGIPAEKIAANMQMFTQIVKARYQPTSGSSLDFSDLFNVILRRIFFKLRDLRPCCLANISFNVDLPDEDEINVAVTGCCLGLQDGLNQTVSAPVSVIKLQSHINEASKPSSAPPAMSSETDDMMFPMEGVVTEQHSRSRVSSTAAQLGRPQKQLKDGSRLRGSSALCIELSPLNSIYNGHIDKYLGYYNFFFIRESTSIKECGGVGGFMQSFILEVKAIARAHVAALGGNALVAYNMSQCMLENNPHKNQGQCLINVSGDVVSVLYDGSDRDALFDMPVLVPSSAC